MILRSMEAKMLYTRRHWLLATSMASAGLVAGLASAGERNADAGSGPGVPRLDPIPAPPATPTPGRAGDFDFLTGEWHIQHWQSRSGGAWDRFEGEASVFGLLGGVASVEELRIPSRGFSGLGLRLLDRERGAWADSWVNARAAVLDGPGQPGSFVDGAGIFHSDEPDGDGTVRYVGVWDRITPTGCRWRQASSRDGGRSWQQSWIMEWRRAGKPLASRGGPMAPPA